METKNYSAIYRIIHWSIAICISLIIITIFLRLNWMNKNHVADIIQNYLSTTDQTLSQDQLIVLAKQIRKPMWDWHIYIGYVLVGLFGIRLLLPLFGEMKFSSPFSKVLTPKEKFQHWVYLIFSVGVTVSLITGMLIEFGPKTLKVQMEEIHKFSIYYLIAFVVIHIGGVLLAELTNQQGIISRIVSGKRKN
jgi:cytochrome b561